MMNKIFIICAIFTVGCVSALQKGKAQQDYEFQTSVEYNRILVKIINNTNEKAWCTGRIKGRTVEGKVLYSSTIETSILPAGEETAHLQVPVTNFAEGNSEINCFKLY